MFRTIAALIEAPARAFWLLAGLVSLGLGAVGALLPLLPTTPFVILAAFAFGKSSPRLQSFLENNAAFGPVIADWRNHGAIAPRFKRLALVMMATVFLASFVMSVPAHVLLIQGLCMTAAAMFILSRPSGPADPKASSTQARNLSNY